MSSCAFAANDPPGRPLPEPSSLPRQVADPDLLEQVLRETLAASDPDGPMGCGEWEALCQVARRHMDVALLLDPVAVQLVAAILATRFHDVACPAELWLTLARQISKRLWEDPPSQVRLHALWARLTEAVR